ncbi:stage III sporulation protein AG [Desulfonispora thiosulfatigenes DSM 11270]|uniref:Stage III sporulation protein AG n=1 Tax=Desulfonispora thiosulfatigenes DSM 11270 TaxID=656914 RepID=A0A1W1VNA9_DESTI|nr:hypothetical protein [Desulfonispora thiosulfatigenes]SMB94837.1 stage III sporulation protein AG [Desulfonispora thiosulfatigenes DSM 11270]
MGDFFKTLFPEDKSKNPVKITAKQKKIVISLVFMSLIGIFLMTLQSPKNNLNPEQNQLGMDAATTEVKTNNNSQNDLGKAELDLEQRLNNILSMIDGAGDVSSTITLESGLEYEYAVNTKTGQTKIHENAKDGSNRVTDEAQEDSQLVMKTGAQGKNDAVVIKEKRPQISGVIVVAEGAKDLAIKEELNSAVQTLLNVPAHRVMILPKGR